MCQEEWRLAIFPVIKQQVHSKKTEIKIDKERF